MSCSFVESTVSIVSLLLGLLWYIGGSPPVLRASTSTCVNLPKNLLKTFVSLLILTVILMTNSVNGREHDVGGLLSEEDNSWCGLSLKEQVKSANLVARASVVSRSRVDHGHYYATFRIDKLLHVSKDPILLIFNEF